MNDLIEFNHDSVIVQAVNIEAVAHVIDGEIIMEPRRAEFPAAISLFVVFHHVVPDFSGSVGQGNSGAVTRSPAAHGHVFHQVVLRAHGGTH